MKRRIYTGWWEFLQATGRPAAMNPQPSNMGWDGSNRNLVLESAGLQKRKRKAQKLLPKQFFSAGFLDSFLDAALLLPPHPLDMVPHEAEKQHLGAMVKTAPAVQSMAGWFELDFS